MEMQDDMNRPTHLLGKTRYLSLTTYGDKNCRLVETVETCNCQNTIVAVYAHFDNLGYVMIVGFVVPDRTIKVFVMGIYKRDGTQYLEYARFLTDEQKNTFQKMRNALFEQEAEHKPKPIHLDLNIVILAILVPLFFVKFEMAGYYAWEYNHYHTNVIFMRCFMVTILRAVLDRNVVYQNIIKTLAVFIWTTAYIHGLGMLLQLAVLRFTGSTMVVPWSTLSFCWILYELSGIKDVDFHIIFPF